MISETITIPKTISDQEDRFVLKLKENLLRMIKEINKNSKKISEINGEEHEDPDYTDEFNSKANVDASNIGYGEDFIVKKNDQGEVTYGVDDNREDWGAALTNDKNTIASDNVTLVSSQNVYAETHPYMAKDGNGDWINNYHYINYKNLIRHEGAVDINKQDRWSEQDIFQPHEPNDNKVKENLIALDEAVWQVSQELEEKANISLNNLNYQGMWTINAIARGSVVVIDEGEDALVRVRHLDAVQDERTGLYTEVYQVYTEYDPSGGGSDPLKANVSASNVGRAVSPAPIGYSTANQNMKNWGYNLGLFGTEGGLESLTNYGHDEQALPCINLLTNELKWSMIDDAYNDDYDPTGVGDRLRFIDKSVTTGGNLETLNEQLVSITEDLLGDGTQGSSIGGIRDRLSDVEDDISDIEDALSDIPSTYATITDITTIENSIGNYGDPVGDDTIYGYITDLYDKVDDINDEIGYKPSPSSGTIWYDIQNISSEIGTNSISGWSNYSIWQAIATLKQQVDSLPHSS